MRGDNPIDLWCPDGHEWSVEALPTQGPVMLVNEDDWNCPNCKKPGVLHGERFI